MKRILAFIITAAVLVTPALAASGQEAAGGQAGCAHSFELTVIREATCAEKGLLAYTCSKCGLTYTAEAPADGEHDYVLTETTASCTEDGEAVYVCSRCGDTYSEAVPAPGHVPEEAPATCTHSQRCAVCGETLTAASGHDYVYQYDAQREENGDFLTFGSWKCANCGKTLDATEGNAVYYYSLPEAEAAIAALSPATATDLEEPAADAEDVSNTDAGESAPAADSNSSLWIVISVIAVAAILAEAVVLVRSLRKKKAER